MRNKTFRIVRLRLTPKIPATKDLAPAPGQGEGWGGGRNLAGAVPAFDPHPSLPPARGKEQLPLATTVTINRAAIRFFANAAAHQGRGTL